MQDNSSVHFVRNEMLAQQTPPINTSGPIAWVRANLFNSPLSTVLTLVSLYILYVLIPPFFNFIFVNGVWTGEDRQVCANAAQGGIQPDGWFGGCWAYVGAYFNQFIYGRYPVDEQWRVNIVAFFFFFGFAPLLMPSAPFKRENLFFMLLVFPVLALVLLSGGHFELNGFLLPDAMMAPSVTKFWVDLFILFAIFCGIATILAKASDSSPMPGIKMMAIIFAIIAVIMAVLAVPFGLEHIETEQWGGLLVTLVIAVTGIVASLPIGVALALGRRSNMPIVKLFSVIFIEFWRGVPLITVLFMASVMLPLFLPDGVTFDKLLRALIGVGLFSAAYMAEVIRGGLQALPKGQYEGAMALGLNWSQMMQKIILPQALKLVIPGIVNTFIGLFKDTTLVLIIGLFDFLGQIQSSFTDPTWASPVQSMSGYLFAAFVYFFFCFGMSRYSIYMEKRLNTGHR